MGLGLACGGLGAGWLRVGLRGFKVGFGWIRGWLGTVRLGLVLDVRFGKKQAALPGRNSLKEPTLPSGAKRELTSSFQRLLVSRRKPEQRHSRVNEKVAG